MVVKLNTEANRNNVLPNVALLTGFCPRCRESLLILPPNTNQVWTHGVLTFFNQIRIWPHLKWSGGLHIHKQLAVLHRHLVLLVDAHQTCHLTLLLLHHLIKLRSDNKNR